MRRTICTISFPVLGHSQAVADVENLGTPAWIMRDGGQQPLGGGFFRYSPVVILRQALGQNLAWGPSKISVHSGQRRETIGESFKVGDQLVICNDLETVSEEFARGCSAVTVTRRYWIPQETFPIGCPHRVPKNNHILIILKILMNKLEKKKGKFC
jgi:hypothetical protein